MKNYIGKDGRKLIKKSNYLKIRRLKKDLKFITYVYLIFLQLIVIPLGNTIFLIRCGALGHLHNDFFLITWIS